MLVRLNLPRVVIVLSIVSLLNDMASDMILPLLPIFLTATLGAGPAIIGLIEGIAEATASLLKLASGWLADRGYDAKKLVVGGYALSNIARPLIAFAFGWTWVLVLRFLDRVGKGIRTSPRDAIVALSVPKESRGRAFGFHRALDHTGATIGPLIAFVLLQAGFGITDVFLFSIVPGLIVIVILVLAIPPQKLTTADSTVKPDFRWSTLDAQLKSLIIAAGVLALATTPEAFVVLWATHHGLEIVWIPLLWAFAHLIKAIIALPAGALSDHWGRKPVMILGWSFRVIMLLTLSLGEVSLLMVWILFTLYAASLAFTEGAERALIGDVAPINQKGTAFGFYHLISSLFILPGAILFGVLWEGISMAFAFVAAAILTSIGASLFLFFARQTHRAVTN